MEHRVCNGKVQEGSNDCMNRKFCGRKKKAHLPIDYVGRMKRV